MLPLRHVLPLIALVAPGLVLTLPAQAQHERGPQRQRIFNPETVQTVSGTVVGVDSVQSRRGPSTGLHLQLQTGGDTLTVHLGPSWYFERQSFAPQVGDSLAARGSRVTVQGAPALIAVEVLHGTRSLRLRDAQGRPVWRGQRKPNP
jgi:hypothetical protein